MTTVLFVLGGALAGFLYHRLVGCRSGACAITSTATCPSCLAPLLEPVPAPAQDGCPDVAPLLSRYLEGEIGAAQCTEMERHVAGCPRCRAQCASLRHVLALCKSEARSGTVPPDVQRAVQQALRDLEARAG